MSDSIRYHILKQIQENPNSTQRELAKSAGISLPARLNAAKRPCWKQDLTRGKDQLLPAVLYRKGPDKGE